VEATLKGKRILLWKRKDYISDPHALPPLIVILYPWYYFSDTGFSEILIVAK